MVELMENLWRWNVSRTIAGLRPRPHNGTAIIETSVAAIRNTDAERLRANCVVNY